MLRRLAKACAQLERLPEAKDAAEKGLEAMAAAGASTAAQEELRQLQWRIQALATNGADDIEAFEIDGVQHLAVANYKNDNTYDIDSKIYRWNGSAFVEIQALATYAAMDFEAFEIDGVQHLAVANSFNGLSSDIDSQLGSRALLRISRRGDQSVLQRPSETRS